MLHFMVRKFPSVKHHLLKVTEAQKNNHAWILVNITGNGYQLDISGICSSDSSFDDDPHHVRGPWRPWPNSGAKNPLAPAEPAATKTRPDLGEVLMVQLSQSVCQYPCQ